MTFIIVSPDSFLFDWNILGKMILVLRSRSPAIQTIDKIFNSAGPLYKNVLFPSGVLNRKAERDSSRVNAYWNTYNGVTWMFDIRGLLWEIAASKCTCLCRQLLARALPIAQ